MSSLDTDLPKLNFLGFSEVLRFIVLYIGHDLPIFEFFVPLSLSLKSKWFSILATPLGIMWNLGLSSEWYITFGCLWRSDSVSISWNTSSLMAKSLKFSLLIRKSTVYSFPSKKLQLETLLGTEGLQISSTMNLYAS